MPGQTKITFVGTGGGGGMVATQKLSTGGTYLKTDTTAIYIDPGPGALLRSRQLSIPLEELDAIFLTHNHLDHAHDIPALIESWVNLSQPIIGLKWLYLPHDYIKVLPIQTFLKPKINKIFIVKPQSEYVINDLTVTTSKCLIEKPPYKNHLPEVYSYWIKGNGLDIGFWSQSQYKKNIAVNFHPKLMIMDFWTNDLGPWQDQVKIIKSIRPKRIILRHAILPMFYYGFKKIAAQLQKETGVETIIAPEGGSLVV